MTISRRAAWAAACAALALIVNCATSGRLAAPADRRAMGVPFGAALPDVERALGSAGIRAKPAIGNPDALVAERCPEAPLAAPCRLLFGPHGLYAAQVEVPEADLGRLTSAAEKGLGEPTKREGPPVEGVGEVVAAWTRPGWTVTVSKHRGDGDVALAALRVEYDEAAPPVVAGVPLGRARATVEGTLERQGAVVVARDDEGTTYLGCPYGTPDAISCHVTFAEGRAAGVTEVLPSPADDKGALEAWHLAAAKLEKQMGRPPATVCPSSGPDRIGGDCTSTWASERLVVVVGAHRSAGSKHRGAISVYTGWTYPPISALHAAATDGAAQ